MSQSGDAQKDGSAPVMFVFAGPNGSGKSSINAQVLKNPALGFLGVKSRLVINTFNEQFWFFLLPFLECSDRGEML